MNLKQVAMFASDLDRARDFYTELTGQEPSAFFPQPGLLFFDLEGVRLLLDSKAPQSSIYLEVDDVKKAVEGRVVVAEPHIIFEHVDDSLGPAGAKEWQAFVKDPDGNTVGLISFER